MKNRPYWQRQTTFPSFIVLRDTPSFVRYYLFREPLLSGISMDVFGKLSMKILWSSCPRKPTIVSVYCTQLVWSICSFILCRKKCTGGGGGGGGGKNAMDGSRVRQSSCLHFIFVVLLTKNDLFFPIMCHQNHRDFFSLSYTFSSLNRQNVVMTSPTR